MSQDSHGRNLTKAALALGLAALTAVGGAAMADEVYNDPYFVNTPAYVEAAAPATYLAEIDTPATTEGTTANGRTRGAFDCAAGSIGCVNNVVIEMTNRWRNQACDHNGTFALTYLITTAQYRHSALTEGFYEDHEFLNHYDAVFADYLFDAYDDYYSGDPIRKAATPPAWRIAFEMADSGAMTGYGDMILGMNAHIIRDLPFVIERIGLVDADGETRRRDHSKVNVFLNEASKIVTKRVADIYDPTIYDAESDREGSSQTTMQLIAEWREEAWRKAEILHTARMQGPEAYAAAAAAMEADAEARATALLENYRATPEEAAARDAHCAGVWSQLTEQDFVDILEPYQG